MNVSFLSRLGHCCLTLAVLLSFVPTATAQSLVIEVEIAEVEFDFNTRFPILVMRLKEASRDQLAEFTSEHLGKTVELRIDGRVVMKPVIREPIVNGIVNMHGTTHLGEAKTLANQLSSGKSRIEVEVVAD